MKNPLFSAAMTPEQRQQLKAHVTEIARILYADAEENEMDMESLGEIEETIRTQLQNHVAPDLAIFCRHLHRARHRNQTSAPKRFRDPSDWLKASSATGRQTSNSTKSPTRTLLFAYGSQSLVSECSN